MTALTATPVGGGPGPQAANLPGTFQSAKLVPKIIQQYGSDSTFNLVSFDQILYDLPTQTNNC